MSSAEKKEYIERNELLELNMRGNSAPITHRTYAEKLIESVPAADVAPVVRCRNCKHYHHYGKTSILVKGKNIKAGWCQRRTRYGEEYRMLPDDYCSYGERKEK